MKPFIFCSAACVVLASAGTHAADHSVGQKDKKFTTTALKAKLGDTVNFRNDDAFYHNIFSLSDGQSFDLGSYGKGQTRSVKLDKPGTIEVECAIHPEMKMTVEVSK